LKSQLTGWVGLVLSIADGWWPKIRQFDHKTAWHIHPSQIGHGDC
jgi:hypothetical protein